MMRHQSLATHLPAGFRMLLPSAGLARQYLAVSGCARYAAGLGGGGRGTLGIVESVPMSETGDDCLDQ
jgi:hypothetical protein